MKPLLIPSPRSQLVPPTLAVIVMLGCCAAGCARTPADRADLRRAPQPLTDGYPAACPVHGTPLREDVVRIVYGLIGDPLPGTSEARASQFPYASPFEWGGCCVWKGQPRRARVMYCPDCRAAQDRWFEASADPPTQPATTAPSGPAAPR
jgi:hypothetical protein